jgi:hypothetical protein
MRKVVLEENPCSNGSVAITPNHGGVIATTGDEDTAIGIYAVNTTQGESVDNLVVNFTRTCLGPPPDTGEVDSDTMIVDSVRYTGYPVGPTVMHTYVISGTLKSVVEKWSSYTKCAIQFRGSCKPAVSSVNRNRVAQPGLPISLW